MVDYFFNFSHSCPSHTLIQFASNGVDLLGKQRLLFAQPAQKRPPAGFVLCTNLYL